MLQIPRGATIGIICRGGPVNGPYAAAALRTLKEGLSSMGLQVANLYGNSASVPAAVLSAIEMDELACELWAGIRPADIVVKHNDWLEPVLTARNLLFREAVLDDSPLEKLIKTNVPLEDVFSPQATPVKIMSVDYLTGKKLVGNNKNPKHRPNWYALMLGSMALTPFLKPQLVYEVVEGELLAKPYRSTGWLADIAVAFDGGYRDNLMFDCACRDGNNVVFVVDINGLEFGPLENYSWEHWSRTLERAFHLLVTTNDRRRLTGVKRTNEILEIQQTLRRVSDAAVGRMEYETATALRDLVTLMETGPLGLANKHIVTIIPVAAPDCSRPFNFANFKVGETMHLLHCGETAAHKALDGLKATS